MASYWEIKEYDSEKLIEGIKNKSVGLPAFQRGVVWNDKQQLSLIDSIKKGFPFGSILLFEDSKTKKLQLIDGLQRSITLYEFLTNPAKFFDEKDIDSDSLNEIIDIIEVNGNKEKIFTDLKSKLITWVKNEHKTMKSVVSMQFYDFALRLANDFPTLEKKTTLVANKIKPMLQKYIKICEDLSKTKIPAIIYYGESVNLPEIFKRINSEGAKLNKYQVFAAAWSGDKFYISNRLLLSIVDFTAERYDNLGQRGSIIVDDYNSTEFKSDSMLNMFEIGFGFGKLLSQKFPGMFPTTDKNTIDSCGFNLINSCLGHSASEMPEMFKNIKKLNSDSAINDFLLKILDTTEEVEKYVKEIYLFKSNNRNVNKQKPLHTELQMVSIISSVFIKKYVKILKSDDDEILSRTYDLTKQSEVWKEYKTVFKKNIRKYYTIDILNEKWRGTGDKKLSEIIVSDNNIYFNHLELNDFENIVKAWFLQDKQKRNESKKIAEPKEQEKVILNLIYSNKFTAKQQNDASLYDFEHLCTKSLMKKLIKKFGGNLALPISSIGNICILPEAQNRSKGEKTIYQDNNYLKNLTLEQIESYSFTNESDLAFLNNVENGEELKRNYNNFIEKRFYEKLLPLIISNVEN
jgi:hypothetical protein